MRSEHDVFYERPPPLGHARIVELSHRPFASIEEHDNALVENWTAKVKPDDIVWVLGDISVEGSYKHALTIMEQLPGRKRLVTGNHDRAWVGKGDFMRYYPEYAAVFEIVTPWARATVDGLKVNLSHFPIIGDHTEEDRFDVYRLRKSDRPLLHGHTHAKEKVSTVDYSATNYVHQVHVGVDAWDYRPVSSHELFPLFLHDDYTMEDRDQDVNDGRYMSWSLIKGKIVYA